MLKHWWANLPHWCCLLIGDWYIQGTMHKMRRWSHLEYLVHYLIYLQESEDEDPWLASCAYSLSEVTGTSLSAHDPLTSLHIAADIYYLWWSHNNNISHLSIYTFLLDSAPVLGLFVVVTARHTSDGWLMSHSEYSANCSLLLLSHFWLPPCHHLRSFRAKHHIWFSCSVFREGFKIKWKV